jgi:hypothetical protein
MSAPAQPVPKRRWGGSLLLALAELRHRFTKRPWACIETAGVNERGELMVSCRWNAAFTRSLRDLGLEGITEEELVQLFLVLLGRVTQDQLQGGEDVVNPEATPLLSGEHGNIIKR